MSKTIKLAEALLRRKELNIKVQVLANINDRDLFEVRTKRTKITDSIDDIIAQVPKITASQVTAELDFYSKQLRQIDAKIQQMNWTVDLEVNDDVMGDFIDRS